jgi:hypothetical protein
MTAYPRRAIRALVLASILLFPTLYAIYHLTTPRDHGDFNPSGDRRPTWLDPTIFPLTPEPPEWKRHTTNRAKTPPG